MDDRAADLRATLREECLAMTRHALREGRRVPGRAVALLDGEELDSRDLVRLHNQLSAIVRPATPTGLTYLERLHMTERDGMGRLLSSVPMLRRTMLAMLCFLVAFLTLALPSFVDEGAFDLFHNSGVALLVAELFVLSAAGLGATFAVVFHTSRAVADGRFDPANSGGAWVQLLLGVVSGVLLAELLQRAFDSGDFALGPPLLALLGGFAADVVHRLLARLTDTLETLLGVDKVLPGSAASPSTAAPLAGDLVDARLALSAGDTEEASRLIDAVLGDVAPGSENGRAPDRG